MNPILSMILNALIKYLNDNPQQVEILIKSLLDFIVSEVQRNK